MKKLKSLIALAAATILAGSLVACGNGDSAAASEEASNQVVIGTLDLVNGDLIAQYEDWYTQELGVDVKIIKFDSGKDINSAIASGSIDIGQVGSSPATLAIANGLDIEVFWIGDIIGKAETLVAKNGSGISTLADLKGKKVATPFASTAHYSLLNALKLEGIDESEVTILDMETDKINAAWQTGDIDAAYVWYPVLSELLKDGTAITDSEELAGKGVVTADTNVVRRAYADANPDVITKFVELQLRANDIINNDSDKAAEEIASVLEISKEDAAEQITQFTYLTADEEIDYLDSSFAATLKDTADFLVEQKSITSAPELSEFNSKVTSEFVKKAASK
ncbi:MAG: aliphatic sulfonate ABC transporter substrate-binding protein [Lachnospiraceae bacterium]|nr:aliphatic sulfonate ABC transporter substrate-binding protein [Lachnospiraceae bacterium]